MGLNAFAMYDKMTGKDRGNAEHNRRVEEAEDFFIQAAAEELYGDAAAGLGAAVGGIPGAFVGKFAGAAAGHAVGKGVNEMRRRFR